MSVEVRPRTAVAILVVVLLAGTVGSAAVSYAFGPDEAEPETEFVRMEPDGALLWPYTSSARSFDARTLPINLVVYGNTTETREHLLERGGGQWNEPNETEEEIAPSEADAPADAPPPEMAPNGTAVAWGTATGSTRYTYVNPAGEGADGTWSDESYQLHDGTYFGDRHHIRAYEDPVGGEWTAMQAHREHWDWFRLRHTVDSVSESQRYVEREFEDRWYTEDLRRVNMHNGYGFDADGWVTVVDRRDLEESAAVLPLPDRSGSLGPIGLLAALGLLGLSLRSGSSGTDAAYRRVAEKAMRSPFFQQSILRTVLLANTVVALYLFVRLGALTVELAFPGTYPKFIAAAFYPLVFAGLPVAAYLRARQLERPYAFVGGAAGFTLAVLIDYTYLGVVTLPIDMLVHRLTLAVALGVIAASASRSERHGTEHGLVRTGVLLWVAILGLPLLTFLPV